MNVGFISLGCSKNLIDTEVAIGKFKEHEFNIVNDPKEADIIVVNTCGFIESAKEEAINTILEMAEYKNGRCKFLIAMGCLVQRYYEDLKKAIPEVDLWIKLDEYDHLWDKIEDLVKRNIDSLEEYDLLKYLKKTTNNIFVSEENLTERIDGLLELGFESKLKEGLDLLNYDLDSIKKIKLCIELGVNINEIDSMLVNGLSNIPNDSLSDYLYSAVEYNKPVSDLVKSKDEFLDSLSEYEDGKRLYNIDGVLISKNKVKRAFSKIDTNQVSTSTVYDIITANTILNDSECERIVSTIGNNINM